MAWFYIGIGSFFLVCSSFLYFFTIKVGWLYLAMGLAIFGSYALVKGMLIYKVSVARFNYFKEKESLSLSDLKSEKDYNFYRLKKKEINRRRYIYTLIIGSIVAVLGIVIGEKGLIIGTIVPIVLFAGVEFSVGLLTEFRLWEYQRQLEKV
ncbi:MAG: hypothetical protein RLZZ546_2494 [Bacteroidota bacterium]